MQIEKTEKILWNTTIKRERLCACAVGFIVRETEGFIWIAATIGVRGYQDITRISKKSVVSRTLLSA